MEKGEIRKYIPFFKFLQFSKLLFLTFKQDFKHKSQYYRTQTSQLISFSKAEVTAHRPSPRTDGWPFKSKDTSKRLLSSLIMKY